MIKSLTFQPELLFVFIVGSTTKKITNTFMMANILPITVLLLFMVLAPNLGWGCSSYSYSNINQTNSTHPTFTPSNGVVGIEVDVGLLRRKREASPVPPSKSTLFTRLDMNKNGQLQLEEWVAAKGQIKNFEEFLKADDSNGDAQISLEEFQQISSVTFNPQ